jgi:hypothetical protein
MMAVRGVTSRLSGSAAAGRETIMRRHRFTAMAAAAAIVIAAFTAGDVSARSVAAETHERGALTTIAPWTHVATGPLATATGRTAAVRYPAGIAAGDLLLLACQGRNNAMRWSAPGFGSITTNDLGPGGLRFALLTTEASGTESGRSVVVANATGLNGWSCSITVFRGGTPSDADFTRPYDGWASEVSVAPANRLMASVDDWDVDGWLMTHWFVSRDDNNHGNPSHGTLAFGGPAYDTTVGTDHAASMAWRVGTTPTCWPPEECPPPPEPPFEELTMQQRASGADPYVVLTAIFTPCWDYQPGPVCP